jgi:hypothetical protein
MDIPPWTPKELTAKKIAEIFICFPELASCRKN